MGEKYRKWLENSDGRQILESFKFDGLDEDLQEQFENIYEMGQERYDSLKGQKAVKQLAVLLSTSVQSVKDAIRYLENLAYTPGTGVGMDPHVFEGDQHHRGLSHNQSIQDNNY